MKLKMTASAIIDVDLSLYPDGATMDDILEIEKKNLVDYPSTILEIIEGHKSFQLSVEPVGDLLARIKNGEALCDIESELDYRDNQL